MSKLRHWKQQYDPNARFVFRKRINWTADQVFMPGDVLPKDLQESLGRGRLRSWWEGNLIELRDFTPPGEKKAQAPAEAAVASSSAPEDSPSQETGAERDSEGGADLEAPSSPEADVDASASAGDQPVIEDKGGGWFEVIHNGSATRVRGRAAAEEFASALVAPDPE